KNGLVEGIAAVQRTMHHAISAPTQRAGLAAIGGLHGSWQREMHAAYDHRRRLGYEPLSQIPRLRCALPEATFYYWVKVDRSMRSADMVRHFAEAGVAVRSGTEFGSGGEGYIRLTFAVDDEELLEGIDRLARAAETLPR